MNPYPTETRDILIGTMNLEVLMDTMNNDCLTDSMSQDPINDSQTKDLDEDSTRGFDIIARVFGLPRHKEAIIDPDSSLSYY